jgi:hypothetical protein
VGDLSALHHPVKYLPCRFAAQQTRRNGDKFLVSIERRNGGAYPVDVRGSHFIDRLLPSDTGSSLISVQPTPALVLSMAGAFAPGV